MENMQVGQAVVWYASILAGQLRLEKPVKYIGKVLEVYQVEAKGVTVTKIAFGTPHGILELLNVEDLRIATGEDCEKLLDLEDKTAETKRTMYGGAIALQELTRRALTPKQLRG